VPYPTQFKRKQKLKKNKKKALLRSTVQSLMLNWENVFISQIRDFITKKNQKKMFSFILKKIIKLKISIPEIDILLEHFIFWIIFNFSNVVLFRSVKINAIYKFFYMVNFDTPHFYAFLVSKIINLLRGGFFRFFLIIRNLFEITNTFCVAEY